jgi:hypothetical protein
MNWTCIHYKLAILEIYEQKYYENFTCAFYTTAFAYSGYNWTKSEVHNIILCNGEVSDDVPFSCSTWLRSQDQRLFSAKGFHVVSCTLWAGIKIFLIKLYIRVSKKWNCIFLSAHSASSKMYETRSNYLIMLVWRNCLNRPKIVVPLFPWRSLYYSKFLPVISFVPSDWLARAKKSMLPFIVIYYS